MKAIVSKLRDLLILVKSTPVQVDLCPQKESVQDMVKFYYQGVGHLKDALSAFLMAIAIWKEIKGE